MKLIIDIDDELVETAKFAVHLDMGSDYVKSIANGIPLDDIKAEIRQKQWHIGVDSVNQVIEIIEKPRAERSE